MAGFTSAIDVEQVQDGTATIVPSGVFSNLV
jgi:hypothetical protein